MRFLLGFSSVVDLCGSVRWTTCSANTDYSQGEQWLQGESVKTTKQILHAKKMNALRVQAWRERQAEKGLITVQVIIHPDSLPALRDLEKQLRRGAKIA